MYKKLIDFEHHLLTSSSYSIAIQRYNVNGTDLDKKITIKNQIEWTES